MSSGNREDHTYVLFMDVNKTIMMADPAGGKSVEDVCNDVIAEQAWGNSADPSGPAEDASFALGHPELVFDRPSGEATRLSYVDWVRAHHPEVVATRAAEGHVAAKDVRRKYVKTFTCPGQPGEAFAPIKDALRDGIGTDHLIVTSFLAGIVDLEAKRMAAETPFQVAVVFRTFGTDLPEILHEFNAFCDGDDPRFPGVSFPHLKVDVSSHVGSVRRVGTGGFVALNTVERVVDDHGHIESDDLDQPIPDDRVLLPLDASFLSSLLDRIASPSGSFAIRDDYPAWARAVWNPAGGKIFPVVLDPASTRVSTAFFDDNINYGDDAAEDNIVCPIDSSSGDVIPIASVLRTHAVRVDPLSIVLNPTYYIDLWDTVFHSFVPPTPTPTS